MKKITLKRTIIRAFANLVGIKEIKQDDSWNMTLDNKLILITSFGIVEGIPIESEEKLEGSNAEELSKSSGLFIFSSINKNATENYLTENELTDNDGFIALKNVKIITSNSNTPIELPFLNIFIDSIIGTSFGKIG